MAKSLSRIVEMYLHIAFINIAILHINMNDMNEWIINKANFEITDKEKAYEQFLQQIEGLERCIHVERLC